MYCPTHFQEDRPEALLGLIERFPLATIVCCNPSGLVADHLPLRHETVPGSAGKLLGHVARNNPIWQIRGDQELLVVFQGPSAYISPNWYATKQEAGRVVPTWNYAVVHAHCRLAAIHDQDRVLQIITQLTDQHEASQPHPWRVTDAPREFTERLTGNIVGIELSITRMHGKWKVSQNQPARNRASVARGLRAAGGDTSAQMAQLIESQGST